MTDSPKEIVKAFVQEKFPGKEFPEKVDGLKDFCFAELKRGPEWKEYRGPGSFDCDNTRLARAIYVLLWGGEGNIFPELTMENLGTGKDFRGETMNSFNSVLNNNDKTFDQPVSQEIKDWVEENAAYSGDKKTLPETISHWDQYDGMGEAVKNFYLMYHTIGNFVVLPHRSAENTTLNWYRGTNTWHDFFDRFLIELGKVFSGSVKKDAKLNALVERNKSAFEGKTLPELADELFLCDYMDETARKPKPLFAPYSTGTFHKNIDHEEYRAFAMRYIDTATRIINNRAEIMCDKLKNLLKDA